MESLGDAYTSTDWQGRDPRRIYAGICSFAIGVIAIITAIIVGTGTVNELVGVTDTVTAQGIAGVVAGLGVPLLMIGIVVVLPASRRERLGVLVGTVLCVGGVWLFTQAYPYRWTIGANTLAFPTTVTYFLGGAIAFWFVLTAITDFHVRNNPTGNVQLELTRQGETRTVHVSREEYRRYRNVLRSDGGNTDSVIQELESRFDE